MDIGVVSTFLATVNNAAVNMGVQISIQEPVGLPLSIKKKKSTMW